MVKQTKRSRKFNAKGGVQARLKKGTITNKGKLKKRKSSSSDNKNADHQRDKKNNNSDDKEILKEKQKLERDNNDFTGETNIGDLDLDTFLSSIVTTKEEEENNSDEKSAEKKEKRKNTKDDDDDDDSDNDNNASESDSDGSDDMDEEDIEAAEKRMKKEIEELKSTDPEFHSFLKENEQSLLQFGDDDEEVEDDDDDDNSSEDDESDEDETKKAKKKKQVGRGDDDDNDAGKGEDSTSSKYVHLTSKLLKSYEKGAFQSHGIKSLKKLVNAYKSACYLSDQQDDIDDGKKKKKQQQGGVHIDSSELFDKLMVMSLNLCHKEFYYHIFGRGSSNTDNNNKKKQKETEDADDIVIIDNNKPIHPKKFENSTKFNGQMKSIMSTFLKSTLHLLESSSKIGSTTKDKFDLQVFVLKEMENYIPYLTPFYPKISQSYLKVLVGLWSSSLYDDNEDYQLVRLESFLRIRQLAITQPYPFIEDCLKKTYLAYAKRARISSGSGSSGGGNIGNKSLPTLVFMGNCVVELYSLDYTSTYQHAFVYIRQLALLLRGAIQKKSVESVQQVYCWQYVYCLKLWTCILCNNVSSIAEKRNNNDSSNNNDDDDKIDDEEDEYHHDDKNEIQLLKSLVYPLVEIILGVIRLLPTTRYLPLRLHCIRLLQQLAASTETYIPTISIILSSLDIKEFYQRPMKVKSSNKTKKGINSGGGGGSNVTIVLPLILRLPKELTLRTYEQQECCMNEIFVLLNREIDLYRYTASFPEYTSSIVQRLRKFIKNDSTHNSKWRSYAKGCIDLCTRYSSFVITERSKINDSPKDASTKKIELLKPSNIPNMHQRYEKVTSKENRLEVMSQPVITKTKGIKATGNNSVDDSSHDDNKANKKQEKKRSYDEDEDNSSSGSSIDEESEGSTDEEEEADNKKSKRRRRSVGGSKNNEKKKKNDALMSSVDLDAAQDEVQEGIDWSSDDESSDDE